MSNKLIAGNWKMNLDHRQTVGYLQRLNGELLDSRHDFSAAEVAVFPPFTDLRTAQMLIEADKMQITYGAQDVSAQAEGAFTGEVAAGFLTALGCKYVLIGHSERRVHDSDELVSLKLKAALQAGLHPILCVGEKQEQGAAEAVVAQAGSALDNLTDLSGLTLAYEPVWAIGTGKTPSAEQAAEVVSALKARWPAAVLYGGSVNKVNAAAFFERTDGLLVGGASLDPLEFAALIKSCVL